MDSGDWLSLVKLCKEAVDLTNLKINKLRELIVTSLRETDKKRNTN